MTHTVEQLKADELFRKIDSEPIRFLKNAAEAGRTVSAYMEDHNPSEDNETLDAFGRLMREAGIVRVSDPAAGLWASPAEDFRKSAAGRVLLQEFFAREWRKVAFGVTRSVQLHGDDAPGSFQRPYQDAQMLHWSKRVSPAIPLSALVTQVTPITGADYRSLVLNYDAEQLRMFRVGESAEIPIATLSESEHTIRLRKYGRGMRASYELLRRMRVDKLSRHIQMMAVQSEIDKVTAAIDVIVNGDGNTDTSAESFDLTTLDGDATAGTLSLIGYLAFKLKFSNPYAMTTALATEAIALQMMTLNMGSANIPLVQVQAQSGFGGFTQINPGLRDQVALGWTADAPASKIVGFDSRFEMEHLVEIGSDIAEAERFITNQTEVMVMSEVSGFAVEDNNAAKILNVGA